MKTKLRLLAAVVIAGGTMFAQPRVSIGIGVNVYAPGYYPPPAYGQYMPPCPGPGYAWVNGYWVPQGGRNVWINGYWNRPYARGLAVAPRNEELRDHERGRGYSNGFRR
jgi:hypothetical protein